MLTILAIPLGLFILIGHHSVYSGPAAASFIQLSRWLAKVATIA